MPQLRKYTVELPVSPERVYRAWLDGAEQSRFSGGAARIESRPEGSFSAADGQITGKILSLSPYDRIVQTWKAAEDDAATQVELRLEATCLGSQLTLRHVGEEDGTHLRPWEIDYADSLQQYLEELTGDGPVDIDG